MDAAIYEDVNIIGAVIVMRNVEGSLIACCSKVMEGMFSSREVEALCLREAIRWVISQQYVSVIFETDSKLVVNAINNSSADLSKFGLLIQECKLLLSSSKNFLCSFVNRQAHVVSHSLARVACSYTSLNV